MKFDECFQLSGLAPALAASPYAQWRAQHNYGTPIFDEDNAHLILQTTIATSIAPAALSVTWLNESSFLQRYKANDNGHPEDNTHWDVGPLQTNVHWLRTAVEKKLMASFDESQVFGSLVDPEAIFDGDVLANLIVGSHYLLLTHTTKWRELGFASPEEMQVTYYTGKDHQPYRRQSYRNYQPFFAGFFNCYQTN